jgi:hypothetical protein
VIAISHAIVLGVLAYRLGPVEPKRFPAKVCSAAIWREHPCWSA